MPHSILIIDDSVIIRKSLTDVLKDDFDVVSADCGQTGFLMAIEKPPSLVIIDIEMPGWDGIKTLKTFRNHVPLQSVYAIMLTANSKRDSVVAAIQAGAQNYILKLQYHPQDLVQKIRIALGISRSEELAADRKYGLAPLSSASAVDFWE